MEINLCNDLQSTTLQPLGQAGIKDVASTITHQIKGQLSRQHCQIWQNNNHGERSHSLRIRTSQQRIGTGKETAHVGSWLSGKTLYRDSQRKQPKNPDG
jgi:hypothetical protein